MLAIGRALMAMPRVMLLDEPSLGLAPIIINEIFTELTEVNRQLGMTILIVEQNAKKALMLSHRAYVLQTGKIVMEGNSKDLLHNPEIEEAYLGGKEVERSLMLIFIEDPAPLRRVLFFISPYGFSVREILIETIKCTSSLEELGLWGITTAIGGI